MNEVRKTGYEDIKVIETAPGFAGGDGSAYRVEFLDRDQGRNIIYFLVEDGIVYEIMFYTLDRDYHRDRPIFEKIFEKMINSFRLIS